MQAVGVDGADRRAAVRGVRVLPRAISGVELGALAGGSVDLDRVIADLRDGADEHELGLGDALVVGLVDLERQRHRLADLQRRRG